MKISIKGLAVAGLAGAVLLTGFAPSQAAVLPMPVVKQVVDVEQVQYRPYEYRDGRPYYWRGHRGYRHARPGYRYYNGYWFPLAAFAAGAVIGGAIASQPAPVPRAGGINPKHYQWCLARYRSYDAYSNTFQPYYGPRQQCLSPYY